MKLRYCLAVIRIKLTLDMDQWPILDFSKFPNNMISGLTIEEINEALSNVENENQQSNSTSASSPALDNNSYDTPTTSSNGNGTRKRFAEPVSDDQLQKRAAEQVPEGTKNRNKWACNIYNSWAYDRQSLPDESALFPLPRDFKCLLQSSTNAIDYWVSKFIYEIRKRNGDRYPRNTLVSITAGINALFHENGNKINLFKDDEFMHFRSVLDMACKESASSGIGCHKKQAEVISHEEEEILWSKGMLGDSNPQTLIDTLLYFNGLHFALRSGNEHRTLTMNQISIIYPTDTQPCYTLRYSENVSKTNNGGLKFRKVAPKVVTHIDQSSVTNPSRSHALLLIKYLEKREHISSDAFYLTPIKNPQNGTWYMDMPIGHNVLGKTVGRLCQKAGIRGYKTNHSLRATCATRLFDEGVDEQLIMNRTGHRTTTGVRTYKRISEMHNYNTSVIIDNKSIRNMPVTGNNTISFHFHDNCQVTINNGNSN